MKSYDKTLWENNKTVVDADCLNNIEDQVNVLTLTTIENNSRIQDVEDMLPMKAHKDHTHMDLATNEIVEELQDNLATLQEEFESLKAELQEEFKKYFDDADIEDNMLNLYSNGVLLKSIQLPEGSPRLQAVCGEILCGDVVSGQGLEQSRAYTPTLWQDGVTPVNAANLNKIESKIVELFGLIEDIELGGGSVDGGVHIGDTAPTNTGKLWVDNSDELPNNAMDNDIIESFAEVLREHKQMISELYYITDAYLDDGSFTDTEDSENIFDGGTF